MLKLMPILERMGACDESRMWAHEKSQRPNLERWLVEYAYKHGCAVEVAS